MQKIGSPVKPGMTAKEPGMTVEMADQVGRGGKVVGHDGKRDQDALP